MSSVGGVMHEKGNVDATTLENIYHPFTAATQMQHVPQRGIQNVTHIYLVKPLKILNLLHLQVIVMLKNTGTQFLNFLLFQKLMRNQMYKDNKHKILLY